MKLVATIIFSVICSILIFAFIAGLFTSTRDPIRTYKCKYNFDYVAKSLKEYIYSDTSLSVKIDSALDGKKGRRMWFRLTIRNGSMISSYDFTCRECTDDSYAKKTCLNLGYAIDEKKKIGGHFIEDEMVEGLVKKFEVEFLDSLNFRKGINFKPE